MGKHWNKVLLLGLILAVAWVLAMVGCTTPEEVPGEDEILVEVHVLTDQPETADYEPKEGEPESVGVYEFYLKEGGVPGTATFRQLDSIPLDKMGAADFNGTKIIKKIEGTLCVGYPPINFIDGKACVEIDQSQSQVNITVHYWETRIAITGGSDKK